MIVVFDTTPLNYLLLIGQVDLLPKLFDRIVAPPTVIVEMKHPKAPEIVRNWASHLPAWLESVKPTSVIQFDGLDAGESEAISLAKELNADLLLIDDLPAKRRAIKILVKATGTLGVLELASARGLINLATAVNALRQTTFRYSEKLLNDAIERNRST